MIAAVGQPASPKRSVGGPISTILTIAVKDATEIWRDGRFRWAAGLLFLLILAAVAGGVHNQSQIARQHADAQRAERDEWIDKAVMTQHAAAQAFLAGQSHPVQVGADLAEAVPRGATRCGNMLTDTNECKQNDATSGRHEPRSSPCREAASPTCPGRSSSGDSH